MSQRLIEEHDDLYSIRDFIDCVKSGLFIDYDGYGEWATDTHILNGVKIEPSKFLETTIGEIPEEATQIVWYNK